MESNADYVIEKLREINFPLPRRKMYHHQKEEILKELDYIEQSLVNYRKILSNIPEPKD